MRGWNGKVILAGLACALAVWGCSASGGRGASRLAGGGPLRLAPEPAWAGTRIVAVLADRGVRLERCRFEWRRNGTPIPVDGAAELDPRWFSKGDRIQLTVTAPGSEGAGPRHWRAETRVVNSPPTVLRVSVEPGPSAEHAELVAVTEASDADYDSLTYTFRWFRNGQPVATAAGPRLAMAGLAIGDQVTVEVVAEDGEAPSSPMRSEMVRVENRPPAFTSTPAAPGPSDSEFRYQAAAADPDGDALRYELVEGPKGMSVEPGGQVVWALPADARRSGSGYPVTLRTLDSKGTSATQRFTIRLGPTTPGR